MDKEVIPVAVYVAQGQLEASVVKSRLESAGIPAILQYESLGVVFGMTVDGLGRVKVMVPQPLEAQARAVLEEATEDNTPERPPTGVTRRRGRLIRRRENPTTE
jgi:hypothetical protein